MGVGGLRVSPVPLRWCIGGAPYCLTVPPTLLAQADDVNRIGVLFAAVHESLVGTKRTCRGRLKMSAHRGKADLALRAARMSGNDLHASGATASRSSICQGAKAKL